MRRLIFAISLLLLSTNILLGFILTGYPMFNIFVTSGVVMITSALLLVLEKLKLKDAFCISLSALILIFGVIQFILGLISPPLFVDNWYLITMIIMAVFEVVLLTISKYASRTVK